MYKIVCGNCGGEFESVSRRKYCEKCPPRSATTRKVIEAMKDRSRRNPDIAKEIGVSASYVAQIRHRYVKPALSAELESLRAENARLEAENAALSAALTTACRNR